MGHSAVVSEDFARASVQEHCVGTVNALASDVEHLNGIGLFEVVLFELYGLNVISCFLSFGFSLSYT